MDVINMDNSQSRNETNRNTTEQIINENAEDCECYRQADVLDQTRLRALILFLYTAII
jgi:hypothetical protein